MQGDGYKEAEKKSEAEEPQEKHPRGFVPFKFVGMSSSLRKRLKAWRLVFGGKSGGRAHYFQGIGKVSHTHTPKTAAWKAKQRRKGKLARKARRIRRIHA